MDSSQPPPPEATSIGPAPARRAPNPERCRSRRRVAARVLAVVAVWIALFLGTATTVFLVMPPVHPDALIFDYWEWIEDPDHWILPDTPRGFHSAFPDGATALDGARWDVDPESPGRFAYTTILADPNDLRRDTTVHLHIWRLDYVRARPHTPNGWIEEWLDLGDGWVLSISCIPETLPLAKEVLAHDLAEGYVFVPEDGLP